MTVKINDEVIPEDAIRMELRRLIRFYSEHMPGEDIRNARTELLAKAKEQAIGGKLLLAEARRQRIAVAKEDAEAKLRGMIEQCGGDEAFRAMLKRQNLTEALLRVSILSGLQVDKLVEQLTAGLPEPTEEEARKFYHRHEGEFGTRERAQVRHILLKPASASAEDKAITRAKLLGIKRQIEEDGADFAALAQTHSECPSAPSGGVLGWITRGTTVPAFDSSVFALDVGEVSGVIETPLGLHLLQQVDHDEGHAPTFEDVKPQIFDIIRHSRRGKVISDFVSQLKGAAVIEDDGEDPVVDDSEWMAKAKTSK